MSETEAGLIERLTAERDKAREEAGVCKYRMDHYREEMYRYLHKVMEQGTLLEKAWEEGRAYVEMHRGDLDHEPTNPYRESTS